MFVDHNKNETHVLGNAIPVLGRNKNGGGTYFGYFSR